MITFTHNKFHAETHHEDGQDKICPFSGTFYISGDLSANTPVGYGGSIDADTLDMTGHLIYGLSATDSNYGVIRLATNSEVESLSLTNVAVTPAGLSYLAEKTQSHHISGSDPHIDVAATSPSSGNSLVYGSGVWSITNPPSTVYFQATNAQASASSGFPTTVWISPEQLRREIRRQMPAWFGWEYSQNANTSGSLRISPFDIGYGFNGIRIESSNSSGNWVIQQ